ncbi:uncharacterized protein NCU06759 [Neurospora crassa OR74A]|uniref:Uncharacterized protein n=1 Tax=Neurospora crassa (strain ATCC 24698 / 74-OR23-1A / CBS 708.71 / DSM 1257 / FGSC 987) TaxID=367110 RepID=V5IN56_NEUCR|nr:uncharacterized protein NCU06759 [Neurospora crassa OR74A]ESA43583.1 hypothetical protein, variant [Neurospora crassa OR74A]|eukprot:XP_011393588.1 uncharacterized protein NCU06759 [Neurospora crassa OR74A]
MPDDDDDERDHRRSAAPTYADPDSDLDSDLHSIKSPSHPPLPSLTTITSGSPTPPNHPQSGRNRYALHQHGSRSPSPSPLPSSHHLPPPAASTLYHLVGGLGLGPSSPLSPFRRQFSAPLQAVRSSSRAPSFASIAGSHPGYGFGSGYGSGSGNSFFTHVNDSRGTVHHLAVKDDDNDNTLSFHADDELSDDDQPNQYPRARADTAAAVANKVEDDHLTQDSKDVLVERLTDLIHHLQEAKEPMVTNHGVLSDVSISELHAKVDEMEAVLTGKGTGTGVGGMGSGDGPAGAVGVTGGLRVMKRPVGPSARRSKRSQASSPRLEESEGESESGGEGDKEEEEEEEEEQLHSPLEDIRAFESSAAAAATAPGWLAKSFSGSEPSPPESRAHPPLPSSKVYLKLAEAAEITPSAGAGVAAVEVEAKKQRGAETERIAAESEKLAAQLEAVLKSLETRREESNHVHALLVERAEAAASRILELEKEVLDLEDEISYQESELKHLRLELRAIETLVNEFLPPVEAADPELVRSIENWKADWKRLRDQMLSKSRRKSESESKSEINHHHRQHETDPEGQDKRPRDEKKEKKKKKDTKHEHEHEHEHELHKEKEEVKAYETHELSVVEEVTEESLRQGHHYHYHPHHLHHLQQQQQQQQPESNGRAVLGSGVDGLEEEEGSTGGSIMSSHDPPAHDAARVSRTGA